MNNNMDIKKTGLQVHLLQGLLQINHIKKECHQKT